MKTNGLLLLNGKDEHIKSNYKKFISDQETYFYQAKEGSNLTKMLQGLSIKNIFSRS